MKIDFMDILQLLKNSNLFVIPDKKIKEGVEVTRNTDTGTLEDIAIKRHTQVDKQRKLFLRVRAVAISVLITLIAVSVIFFYINRELSTAPTEPVIVITPNEVVEHVKERELYRDDNLMIFLNIPSEAKTFKYDYPSQKFEVIFTRSTEDYTTVNESNLSDGYIFRVTPLSLGLLDINKVAQTKRESFKVRCPQSAGISEIKKVLIDAIDALTFDVNNCNVDYKLTYVPRFGIVYELTQIYKGDIGIKQQHKSKTEELLMSLRFFPEGTSKPYEPFKTYVNEEYHFIFKYPEKMSSDCCDIPGPASTDTLSMKLIALGSPETSKDNPNADVIGVFIDNYMHSNKTDFGTYLDRQRLLLSENYKVVLGRLPETEESEISVGYKTGTLFKGYTWQDNDLIFVEIPANNQFTTVLVISIKNTTGESFENITKGILESFEYIPL